MTAFHFGSTDSPLFGIYAPPRPSVVRDAAVLLCAPIGLEYLRTHYAVRLIAQQLAATGLHVLRFDYRGTGDSSGEVGEGQFGIWKDDVALALHELSEISGVSTPTVVGIRLGAAIALEAIADRKLEIRGLVLWDPVVDGIEYLSVLEQMHGQMISLRRELPRPTNELLGMAYPDDLRDEIRRIRLEDRISAIDAQAAALVVSEDRPEYDALLNAMRNRWPDTTFRSIADPVEWGNMKLAYAARMTGPIVKAVVEATESLT